MTAGVYNLLRWMKFRGGRTGQLWWSQKRMAEELRISVRTLQRYMAELTRAKLVEIVRRGRTSALHILSTACAKALENGGSSGGSKQLYLFSEKTTQKEVQLAPTPIDSLLRPEHRGPVEVPPSTITNEYGRVEPNPVWQRLQGILRSAQDRIRRARNPFAYEQAILRAELRC